MKKVLFALASIICIQVHAGISPSNFNEYCPKTAITFTWTDYGHFYAPYFSNNAYTVGSIASNNYDANTNITTIVYILTFDDIAQNHSIQLNWSDGSPTPKYNVINYPYIKSLVGNDQVVSPNVSTIYVDSCSVSTFTVSFANLPWKNYTTNATFGSITDYGYSVPQGWKVNGSISSGPTDIKYASNSVTIEPDMTHDGSIVIAPVNLCAANLGLGQNVKNIPIVRRRPGLTFQSVQYLCSSASFQANNVPNWVTSYQWYADPSNILTFSNSTSNPTTVSKNYGGQGQVGLLISGPSCPYTFFYNNKEITNAPKITVGQPTLTSGLMLYDGTPGSLNEVCLGVENYLPFYTNGLPYNTANSTPTWSYVSHTGSPQPSWNGGDSTQLYVYFWRTQQTSLVLQIDATNDCGTTTAQFGFTPISCGALIMASYNYSISPNPTKGNIIVTTKNNSAPTAKKPKDAGITRLSIYDLQNTLRLTKKYDSVNQAALNIGNLPAGTYVLVISNGTGTESQQVILR